jgi:hypothetical protein
VVNRVGRKELENRRELITGMMLLKGSTLSRQLKLG